METQVEAGDPLTEGSINPNDILIIKGAEGVYTYLVQEVQKVYRNQGVDINDKHVEVIGRQMLKKVRVEDNADTDMFPGALVDMYEFEDKNKEAEEKGLRPATGKRVLLGITKAALATDSFLSAASFQETTRVLTEAAIKGKVDDLDRTKRKRNNRKTNTSRNRNGKIQRNKNQHRTRTRRNNRYRNSRINKKIVKMFIQHFYYFSFYKV